MIRKYLVAFHVEDHLDPARPAVPDDAIRRMLKESFEEAWNVRWTCYREGLPVGGPKPRWWDMISCGPSSLCIRAKIFMERGVPVASVMPTDTLTASRSFLPTPIRMTCPPQTL